MKWETIIGIAVAAAGLFLSPGLQRCACKEIEGSSVSFVGPGGGLRRALPRPGRGSSRPYEAGFRLLPQQREKREKSTDTVYLKNGDRISGSIEAISSGVLVIRSESLPEEVRIPIKNVQRVFFRGKEKEADWGEASVIFVSGDHLSAVLKGYDGGELVAQTSFCEEVRIKKEDVAGVMFRRPPRVIYREDFEEGDLGGFKTFSGEWGVRGGRLGPLSDASANAAYLKLRQEGHVRYSWRISTERGLWPQLCFFFFSESPDHNAPWNAYWLRMSGSMVYLYRVVQNNSQHVTSFGTQPNRTSRSFEVDYDSGSGTIRVKADGEERIAGSFPPGGITHGEYIIVTGTSNDRLDELVVEQIAEPMLPLAEEGAGEDCVFLANGDRLSGEVMQISDAAVRVRTSYGGEPFEVAREEVSSLGLGGMVEENEEGLPAIYLWNGDQLSGDVVCLEGGLLRVQGRHIGNVEIKVEDISSVAFPVSQGFFESAEGAEEGRSSR